MRIRYGEQVAINEIHDYLDALHNVPGLILGEGDWFTEENIAIDLERYDQRWMQKPGSQFRKSLATMLDQARAHRHGG